MLFEIGYIKDCLFFVIHVLNPSQIYFLQTSYNFYKIKFWYCFLKFFLLSIVETKWWWSDIPTSQVSELLSKSSWFVNIKSMHVGFLDWKHVGDEMRLFWLNRFCNSSKSLVSIVKLKSPINKILSYVVENTFIVLDRLLIKRTSFWLNGLQQPTNSHLGLWKLTSRKIGLVKLSISVVKLLHGNSRSHKTGSLPHTGFYLFGIFYSYLNILKLFILSGKLSSVLVSNKRKMSNVSWITSAIDSNLFRKES